MRLLARMAAGAGWVALSIAALVGIALALAAFLAAAPFSRPLVAARVVRLLDDQIAGRLELQGVEVLARGGIELHGLEVYDPDDRLVLSVGRARAFVDLTNLRARAVGITLELEAPSVLVEEEEDGGVSLARAFAPAHPGPPRAPTRAGRDGPGWSVHVSRLTVRQGDVWWVDARGESRLQASGLDLDARGLYAPDRARADLRLAGALVDPVEAPLVLDLSAALTGDALRVPVLRAEVGGTALDAFGEADVARRTGRVAVRRLGIARALARRIDPQAPEGADLAATGYAESDGSVLTAGLRVEPTGSGSVPGLADVAVAARVDAPLRAAGFTLALERLDPSRIVAGAPAGEVTLTARGAATGRSLRDLRGHLAASIAPSRLRRGSIRRGELAARADRGVIEVARATLSVPGGSLEGALRWREGGGVSGRLVVDGTDLSALAANAGALLGERLPALHGRATVEGTLAGTAEAPAWQVTVQGPRIGVQGVSLDGVRLSGEAAGPLRAMGGRLEGTVAAVSSGGEEIARNVRLHGALSDEEGEISARASLPGFRDPASLEARGRLGKRRESLAVSELAFAYPGSRWSLVQPVTVTFAGPSVDHLELASDEQRIAVTGGRRPGGTLDVRASIARLDLARLPAGLLPSRERVGGELTAELRGSGRAARPLLEATFSLAGGTLRTLDGLAAQGSARFDGEAARASASVALSRAEGGTLSVEADVPVPLAGRAGERVLVTVTARRVPLEEVLAALGSDAPLAGGLDLDASLAGGVGAAGLSAHLALSEGEYRDLGDLALDLTVDDPGERLRVTLRGAHAGRRVAEVEAEVPLEVSALLERPAEAIAAARAATLTGSATLTALDLAALAGHAGVPEGVAGTVTGSAELAGSLDAPRARAVVELAGGALLGYRRVGGRAELTLADAATAAAVRVSLADEEALRLEASLGVPVERLATSEGVRSAPLHAVATVPGVDLARASGQDLPLSGRVEGRLTVAGTPRSPRATLALDGESVAVGGRPLGAAHLEASYADGAGAAQVVLRPAAGGTLRGSLAIQADLGLGAAGPPVGESPAEASAVAEGLDLGFLPAIAPGVVRSAAGTLALDLRAQGPLARMRPRGNLRLREGQIAVAELGEWTGIAADATVTDDAVELSRLEVRRGRGKLTFTAAARGLRSDQARLEAHLESDAFTVSRAGMELATLDLRADATGSYGGGAVALDVRIPRGVVRLPEKSPRTLQPLDRRSDIVVGRPEVRRRREAGKATPGAAKPAERPFTLTANVEVPGRLFVKSDDPKIDVELKAKVRYEHVDSTDLAEGTVEAVRGSVEPIADRKFVLEHGRVQFTGGPPKAAMLDVEARYDNPTAVVTVDVEGPVTKPEIRLTSQPPLDEGQIAMLIATGRTELKAGGGAVGTLTGEEAGKAALGVLATQAFKNLVADKLPLDTVALESGAIRAGKYLTDKIYVGYTRRFEADPQRGENADEVRVEYQITPRWTFQSRYGNAQAGGASLIWSKDY